MVCLDTSVLIALIRKDRIALERLSSEVEGGGEVSTTMISLCEMYAGAFGSKDPDQELARIGELVSSLAVLGMDAGVARRYGELVHHPGLKRQPIGDFDLIIASIALQNGETLATRNLKHFGRVPGLVMEQW
jgi:tRNA(fMet)-specific endonuclease VapC